MSHDVQGTREDIPGYDYGKSGAAHTPISFKELQEIEETIGWTAEDAEILRVHEEFFVENAEHLVDHWRGLIGSQQHLAKAFFGADGKRDAEYAARVKPRFVQWVLDVVRRPHDQAWLNYQEEIGLRHLPAKKNTTDKRSTTLIVPLRFILAFVPVICISVRQFFIDAGLSGEELRRVDDAWTKAVQLHVTMWARPYTCEGRW